jgi:hypothetical protein
VREHPRPVDYWRVSYPNGRNRHGRDRRRRFGDLRGDGYRDGDFGLLCRRPDEAGREAGGQDEGDHDFGTGVNGRLL